MLILFFRSCIALFWLDVAVVFVVVDRAGLVFEESVLAVCKVQDVLGQWQDRCNVGNVHALTDMNGQNLGVRVSGDVGLDWNWNVSEVEGSAVLMGIEEGQVHSFMAIIDNWDCKTVCKYGEEKVKWEYSTVSTYDSLDSVEFPSTSVRIPIS